ncbi:uncharacterized protein LOC130238540 [Danio aesculapii]|uniref:uncharacterized protein LOC130238540 n=1 Tax=Danio aesculapii TaxID=1142201 RepID=UPI0024BFB4B4|nr:uncharacterized protein LOC130238540 [Danio aesculapii]
MAINHFVLFLLIFKTGFSAEISKFVQTGASVQLDLQTQQLPEFDDLFWLNDKSENMVKYYNESKKTKTHPAYQNRIEFNETNFSLTLKNMQKADSGRYTAKISGNSNKEVVYRVTVIDAVEAPVLTVKSNWSSSELCSFTCSGRDINISSTYNSGCSEEEVTSADDHTLRLNYNTTFIMCNYSNPVSWKTYVKTVDELCTVKTHAVHGNPPIIKNT